MGLYPSGLWGARGARPTLTVAMLNPAVSTTTVAWYVKPGWPTVGENRGGSEVWPWGAAVSSQIHRRKQIRKRRVIGFFLIS